MKSYSESRELIFTYKSNKHLQEEHPLLVNVLGQMQLLGVNFINVLRAAFTYVSCACSFLCLHFRFVLYWRKTVGAKAARRMLMKLSPGLVKRQASNHD